MRPLQSYVLRSFVPASVGCWLGYQWGLYYSQPDSIGLYATAGAAAALLITRLAALVWTITVDFMQN